MEGIIIGREDVEQAYRQGERFPAAFDAAAGFNDYPEAYENHLKGLAQAQRRERVRARPAPPLLTELPPGPLPGRNAPCWCGSGEEYKACHYERDQERATTAVPAGKKKRWRHSGSGQSSGGE